MKIKKLFLLLSACFLLPAFAAQAVAAEEEEAEEVAVIMVFNGTYTVVMDNDLVVLAVVTGNPYGLTQGQPAAAVASISANSLVLRPPSSAAVLPAPSVVAQAVQLAASITTQAAIPATARASVIVTRQDGLLLPAAIVTSTTTADVLAPVPSPN
ncbi:MAG: hypothetical protein LR015_15805 [Verrucomicrobia bacterium]|nr:hypothetical protein [Verrucomicrobiota bacterium]